MPAKLNPMPKDIFMSSGNNVSAHKKLLESSEFERAILFAKAQYMRRLHQLTPADLAMPNFASGAAMSFERLQGMEDFISILYDLTENTPMPARTKVSDNLETAPSN